TPTEPGDEDPSSFSTSRESFPSLRWMAKSGLASVAIPAESYPRYSRRFKPSRRRGAACFGPTYPTIPHICQLYYDGPERSDSPTCKTAAWLTVNSQQLFSPIEGGAGPAAVHLATALRPPDSLLLREGASARTRGLRPASPTLALRLSPTVSPAKGRFPQEALSEGAQVVKAFASRILRPTDQRRPGGRCSRPGRSVPPREADQSQAAFREASC